MKKLFALIMLFSFVLAFSPHESMCKVNVSDDICSISQNQDVDIIADCDLIAEFNFELINEAEVEISPGVNQEVIIASTNVHCRNLKINSYKIQREIDFCAKSNYILNQEILEISPGDNLNKNC